MGGSSWSCSEFSSTYEGKLSVSDLSPSSLGESDCSTSSESTSAGGLVVAGSASSSEEVAYSLVSTGAPVVLVSKLYCWSREAGKFR